MNTLLRVISSSKLALALVGLLILFSIMGAVLPQEGRYEAVEISRWQAAHPFVSKLFKPFGLFHVFHSVLFLIIISLFTVNTLTCTILYLKKEGGVRALWGKGAMRRHGFLFLHLSLIVIFVGGFLSTAAGMDGYIILTEGQRFTEEHDNYLRIAAGPLRSEKHKGFTLRLNKIDVEYEQGHFHTGTTVGMEVFRGRERIKDAVVKVNFPFTFQGIAFTIGKTGFSPRLIIREKNSGRVLVNSFVALKTFTKGNRREYRDFLPLPFFKQRTIVTFFPQFRRAGGKLEKTGEEVVEPLLLIEMEEKPGIAAALGEAPLMGSAEVGDYSFTFAGLRQWVSFRVKADPGYPLVWFGLLLGFAAILLRYIPDMRGWFSPESNGGR